MAYQPQAADTHPAADRLWFDLWRQQPLDRRLQRGLALQRHGRTLALGAAQQRLQKHPAQSNPLSLAQEFARALLGEIAPPGVGVSLPQAKRHPAATHFTYGGNEMTWQQDQSALLEQLHRLFEQLSLPYFVTGGQAAIVWGEPRFTTDLDIVLAIAPANLAPLTQALTAGGFYVSDLLHNTLNIIHRDRIDNADLILCQNTPFERSALDRRHLLTLPGIPLHYIATAEDLLLAKLQWRQNSQSEKQWRDCLGIVKVQREQLDRDYLAHWAARLGLGDDLASLLAAGGL